MLHLNLVGQLGTSITVDLADEAQVLPTLRRYGRQGWTSGEIPAGGLVLSLSMADHFDWSLIGARAYTTPDGEQAVMYRGQSYKRRELDEVDTKKVKLPRIVKYSRGARPTDPPHLKEGEDGGVKYVSLLRFSGNGRVIEAYLDPQARTEQAQQQAQAQSEPLAAPVEMPAVPRSDLIRRMRTLCGALQTSMQAILADLGAQQWVQIDDLRLAQTVARLEQQAAR